ncbi:MAG: flagellar basal body-associated FliL family protein [Desulfobacterota bacterium]|nr:flagellar basal body-associated FliL family protein [Thermodesulfobacteriota bacterium]
MGHPFLGRGRRERSPDVKRIGGAKVIKYILIGGIMMVLVVGGGLGLALYLGYLSPPTQSNARPAEASPSKTTEMGEIVKLSPLIINLNEENGRHYLKTRILLELEDKKWVEPVQARMSIFTDTVILSVSEKKLDDLRKGDFKERLKEELLQKFNGHLGQKGIRRIYFDEFLFQ